MVFNRNQLMTNGDMGKIVPRKRTPGLFHCGGPITAKEYAGEEGMSNGFSWIFAPLFSGVRPSSAAATSDGLSALDDPRAGKHSEISAAEDGRTPLNVKKVNNLSAIVP